jgi:hypothetical protein
MDALAAEFLTYKRGGRDQEADAAAEESAGGSRQGVERNEDEDEVDANNSLDQPSSAPHGKGGGGGKNSSTRGRGSGRGRGRGRGRGEQGRGAGGTDAPGITDVPVSTNAPGSTKAAVLDQAVDTTQGGIPYVRIDGSHDSSQVRECIVCWPMHSCCDAFDNATLITVFATCACNDAFLVCSDSQS